MSLLCPNECSGCPLWSKGRRGFSAVTGEGRVPLLILGEASGATEERESKPFVGQSGELLNKVLKMSGLERSDYWISNVLRCRPPGNELRGMPYERGALDHCRSYLDQVIAEKQPKMILALGDTALRELSTTSGIRSGISEIRGFVLQSRYSIPMISTYHPAFLMRNSMHLLGVFAHDLRRSIQYATHGVPQPLQTRYKLQPTGLDVLDYLERLGADSALPVAYDIETEGILGVREPEKLSEKKVIQIQFSSEIGTALVLPWPSEAAKVILATTNMKWGWNCLHYNTSVWMADGSWKSIAQIKRGESVKTLYGDRIGVSQVTASLKKFASGKWVKVLIDNCVARGAGRWNSLGVTCTPDHRWLTVDRGWQLAQDLRTTDQVYLPRRGSPDLILGTALGDGHITPAGRLTLSHTNQEWAAAKAASFGVNLYKRRHPNGFSDNVAYEMGVMVGKSWRSKLYDAAKQKLWTAPSDKALAVFYQDDGWIEKKGYARICLQGFSVEAVKQAHEWAEREFGKCSLYKATGGLVLGFLSQASKELFARIKHFVHPSNYYKLPVAFRGYYNGWMSIEEPQSGEVVSVLGCSPAARDSKYQYCLEVDGTHNFFTRGGVVANSRLFDAKILKAQGVQIGGEQHDLMNAWGHLQPNFCSAKDDAHGDKGVPSKLMGLQSCLSFYYPYEQVWKGTVSGACPYEDGPERTKWMETQVLPTLRLYGAKDADYTFRLGAKLFAALKQHGLW